MEPLSLSEISVQQASLKLHDAGVTVIPTLPGGDKKPAFAWKPFTQQRPTREQVETWFANPENDYGVAAISGEVSGNLIMVEVEGRASTQLPQLKKLAEAAGLENLWDTANKGWLEMSPSGGFHWFLRCTQPVPGNQKLARNHDGLVVAETRGTGGYTIVAPTPGSHHETGTPWKNLSGSPATIPTFTPEQLHDFLNLFRTLDETPPPPQPTPRLTPTRFDSDRLSPGDDYENQTDWDEILIPHQWTRVFTQGQTTHWRRPGKNTGTSATTGYAGDRDRIFVFSSSTDFPQETPITKFGAYAILNHAGNFSEAAKDLAKQGYGEPLETVDMDLAALPALPAPKPTPTPESAPSEEAGPSTNAETTTPEEEGQERPPSWDPIDLTPILDGTYQPPEATLFTRTDGQALLYPGLVHDIHGESESGKSLLIQTECAKQIQTGQPVAYIDYESEPVAILERLQLMGATKQQIAQHFTYIRPEQDPYRKQELPSFQNLLTQTFTLIVLDGVTDALGQAGAASKDNDEIATWHRKIPRTLAKHTGAAVVLIDHVTKNNDTRGRFAIGGQTKMAAIDGASYLAETKQPLGRGLQGEISLRVAKDRPGIIRAQSGTYRASDRTQEAALITIDSLDPNRIVTTINPPETLIGEDEGNTFRATLVMEKLSRIVEAYREPITTNALLRAYKDDGGKARRSTILESINTLVDEGYFLATEGPRGARMVRSARVFRDFMNDLEGAEITDIRERRI